MDDLGERHLARLRDLLVSRSVVLGEVTLASGIRSDYYIDARRTTMSGEGQRVIGWVGFDFVRSIRPRPTHVGGLTMGADPIAYAIAHRCTLEGMDIDSFSVRKQAKGHGLGKRVEGAVAPRARALVVEDCVTTGSSAMSAVRALRELGATVERVLALVDRSDGKARLAMDEEGVVLEAFFGGRELAELAGR